MSIKIDARGLSQNEIQTAIDEYIARKNPNYLPQLEQELQQIAEKRKELEKQLKQEVWEMKE